MTDNVLLQDPDEDTTATFYSQLIKRLGCGVEVRLDAGDGRGKGVFAVQPYAKGDIMWRESHVVAVQHLDNKLQCVNCSHCYRFIGTIEQQIAHLLLYLISTLSDPDAEPEEVKELQARLDQIHAAVDAEYIEALMNVSVKLPKSEQIPVPQPVLCCGGCSEQFCSTACRDAAWQQYHCVLCPGPAGSEQQQQQQHGAAASSSTGEGAEAGGSSTEAGGSSSAAAGGSSSAAGDAGGAASVPLAALGITVDQQAVQRFLQHADESNEIFTVAAKALAGTLLKAARQVHEGREQQGNERQRAQEALRAAWLPFAVGYKLPWWEAVACPEDVEDEEEFRAELLQLASESLSLLAQAVQAPAFPELFDLQVYGTLVGLFERNNLSLEVPSPVEDYFLLVDGWEKQGEREALKAATDPLLDALDTAYDTHCQGTAFYSLQSCANHSCDPNAAAETDTDGQVVLLALRSIPAGEEVCISYIDEELPVGERKAALVDYGFVCRCAKCERDRAAAKARRTGVKVGRRR